MSGVQEAHRTVHDLEEGLAQTRAVLERADDREVRELDFALLVELALAAFSEPEHVARGRALVRRVDRVLEAGPSPRSYSRYAARWLAVRQIGSLAKDAPAAVITWLAQAQRTGGDASARTSLSAWAEAHHDEALRFANSLREVSPDLFHRFAGSLPEPRRRKRTSTWTLIGYGLLFVLGIVLMAARAARRRAGESDVGGITAPVQQANEPPPVGSAWKDAARPALAFSVSAMEFGHAALADHASALARALQLGDCSAMREELTSIRGELGKLKPGDRQILLAQLDVVRRSAAEVCRVAARDLP